MLIRLSYGGPGPDVYQRHANLFPGWISPLLSPAMFGIVRNTSPWQVVFALYAEDKLAEASDVMRDAGIGDFAEYAAAAQVVDSETQADQFSLITRLTSWMEIELSPSTQLEPPELACTPDLIEETFKSFGFAAVPPVLLTILPPETLLPPFLDVTGYVTMKRQYAKYCVPHALAGDPDRLAHNLPLLAASHAAGVLSNEGARQWLLCAAQAVVGPDLAEQQVGFCAGSKPWLEPTELDARLMGLRIDDEAAVRAAHEQAILVGKHLLTLGGTANLKRCLLELAPNNWWGHIRNQTSGDPVRDACKRVYGHAPEYLFEHALAKACG